MKGSEFCQRKTKKLNVKQLRIEKRIVMKNLHLHKMLNLTKNVNCSTGATWASVHIRCGDSNHAERSDHYMEQVCQNYWFKCLFLCIKMSNLFWETNWAEIFCWIHVLAKFIFLQNTIFIFLIFLIFPFSVELIIIVRGRELSAFNCSFSGLN